MNSVSMVLANFQDLVMPLDLDAHGHQYPDAHVHRDTDAQDPDDRGHQDPEPPVA